MARVVAQFVDMRGDDFSEAVIFLQINREIGLGLLPNFGQSGGVLVAVDCDANDVGAGSVQGVDLLDSGVDVLRVRRGHALHGNRMATADRGGTDTDFTGGVTWDVQNQICS